MNKIVIKTESVWEECETCGSNFEEGGILKINDKVIFEYKPTGGCFTGQGYNLEYFLVRALLEYIDDYENCITKENIKDFIW